MDRRRFMAAAALAFAAPAVQAGGKGHVKYSREAYEAALASGKPFLLDFYTTW